MTSRTIPRTLSAGFVFALGCVGTACAADPAVEKVSVKAVAHFDFNRTGIRPEDKARILAEVGAMKDVTWQTVKTTGYTDSVGSAGANERLAARRAGAVKQYLVAKGLDPAMIDVIGRGEADPVATNASSTGRAQNRRTEVEFQGIRTVSR